MGTWQCPSDLPDRERNRSSSLQITAGTGKGERIGAGRRSAAGAHRERRGTRAGYGRRMETGLGVTGQTAYTKIDR